MKTMKFGSHTFEIVDCKSVDEMVKNMLREIDPDIFERGEVTRERVREILHDYLPEATSDRIDNCHLFCEHNFSNASDEQLRDIIEEYISR